jgi:hypothetical protein
MKAGAVCSRGHFDGLGVVGVSRKIWLVKQTFDQKEYGWKASIYRG